MILIVILLCVIGIVVIYGIVKVLVRKNKGCNVSSKSKMEYISLLSTHFNRLKISPAFKEEFEDDIHTVINEFETVLAEASEAPATDGEINRCRKYVESLDSIKCEFDMNGAMNRMELLTDTYDKVKKGIMREVKNKSLIKPLCVLIAINSIIYPYVDDE